MVSVPNYFHKNNNTANVAICVPVRDNVTAVFAYSLAMLQKKCGETGLSTSLHFNMGSEVAMQRQQLVTEALETNCTHIMWIDADMQFPVDTLNILLQPIRILLLVIMQQEYHRTDLLLLKAKQT
jgi:hypothetical protein